MNLNQQGPSPLMYENMQNCSVGYPQQMYNNDFTADLDNYLLPADNNPLPNLSINMDDLKNLNVEELFQNPSNQQQQQPRDQTAVKMNSPAADSTIFNINRSTMDNNSHQRFLDLIKQQQNQKMMVTSQDSISNQSSPPPTPSSDWSDIPSPTSSINDFDLKFSPLSPAVPTTQKTTQQPPSSTIQSALAKPKKKPRKPYSTKSGKPRLYRFLKDILNDPKQYPCIEWVNKSTGTFKFLDSSEVARLWGFRKNKPAMKYENFARSLRTYIAKGILTKPRNKLVYCFAQADNE